MLCSNNKVVRNTAVWMSFTSTVSDCVKHAFDYQFEYEVSISYFLWTKKFSHQKPEFNLSKQEAICKLTNESRWDIMFVIWAVMNCKSCIKVINPNSYFYLPMLLTTGKEIGQGTWEVMEGDSHPEKIRIQINNYMKAVSLLSKKLCCMLTFKLRSSSCLRCGFFLKTWCLYSRTKSGVMKQLFTLLRPYFSELLIILQDRSLSATVQ